MIAYLVDIDLTTRVVLPESFSADEFNETGLGSDILLDAVRAKLREKIEVELGDNITLVEEDLEVPYDPRYDDN
jgi:hypothetical protein